MKYKLGHKYYLINRGMIREAVLHSVTITLDGGGIYSEECYCDITGAEIVIVFNKESQRQTRELFASEAKAIDHQIRVLKALKHKDPCAHEHLKDIGEDYKVCRGCAEEIYED